MKKQKTLVPKKITKAPKEKITKIPPEKPDYNFITPWTMSDKKISANKKKKTLTKSQDIFYHFG